MSDIGERDETVPVVLTCVRCGKTETIHVFRERELSGRMLWECLDCQKREDRKEERPKAASVHQEHLVDTR